MVRTEDKYSIKLREYVKAVRAVGIEATNDNNTSTDHDDFRPGPLNLPFDVIGIIAVFKGWDKSGLHEDGTAHQNDCR